MNLIDIFFKATVTDNLLTVNAVGLGIVVLFSYTIRESIWVSLRFLVFLMLQTIILLLIKPYFNFAGREVFMLLVLVGSELCLSPVLDKLFPYSILENGVKGFTKRGDAILPMVLAIVLSQDYSPIETLIYSFGLGIGFIVVLIGMAAVSIKGCFHRYSQSKVYIFKFFILGLLAMIFT